MLIDILIFVISDTFDVYSRLFNHRPFLQGEARHFVKEFEEKRQDSEVDNIFKTLETVTELRDYEIDKVWGLDCCPLSGTSSWQI